MVSYPFLFFLVLLMPLSFPLFHIEKLQSAWKWNNIVSNGQRSSCNSQI